jgi:hypothetical protein
MIAKVMTPAAQMYRSTVDGSEGLRATMGGILVATIAARLSDVKGKDETTGTAGRLTIHASLMPTS